MADEAEIELGRLAVERSLVTQEQVLSALRARNAAPQGPDLGECLLREGLLGAEALAALRAAVQRGVRARARHDASTDLSIPLGNTREAIARECLAEARALLSDPARRDEAQRELKRLVHDFADTESGHAARLLLEEQGA